MGLMSDGMQTRPRLASRPLIGVCGVPTLTTWGFWRQEAVLVARTYLDAIVRAGGTPLILPPTAEGLATELVRTVDAVVLAGGNDIEPRLYGADADPRTEETSSARDLFELEVARAVLEADKPVLGICRGLQVLNVATGGSLHQHLLDEGFAEHRPAPGRLDAATNHTITIHPDSLLSRCGLREVENVNSHHHQGVAEVGDGGFVVARAPDGAVEAVEWPAKRFALGVQLHPEDPPFDGIFRALTASAAAAARDLTPVTSAG